MKSKALLWMIVMIVLVQIATAPPISVVEYDFEPSEETLNQTNETLENGTFSNGLENLSEAQNSLKQSFNETNVSKTILNQSVEPVIENISDGVVEEIVEPEQVEELVEEEIIEPVEEVIEPEEVSGPIVEVNMLFRGFEAPDITFSADIQDAKGNSLDAYINIIDRKTNKEFKKHQNKSLKLKKGKYDIEIQLNKGSIRSILVKDAELDEDTTGLIDIDDNPKEDGFVNVYAIDPTPLKFTEAIVTAVATGTQLYKCKEWNFDEQVCEGEWILFKTGLVPGQEYTFKLTPDDPGFAETLQPNTSVGTDSFVNQNVPDNNYGSLNFLVGAESNGKYAASLLKFSELDDIPSYATVTSAILRLYFYDSPTNTTNNINLSTRKITSDWEESTITWNTKPTYSSGYSDIVTITNNYGWVEWNITNGMQAVINGSSPNYGLAIVPDSVTASTEKRFYSSDYSDESLHPKIEINYTIANAPVITFIWPENNSQHGDGDSYVAYNVTSENTIDSCSLIVNSNVQDTDNSITKDIRQTFKKTTNSDTSFQISVNCTDSQGTPGSSETRTVTINTSQADLYGKVQDADGNGVDVTINFIQGGVIEYTSNGTIHAITIDDGIYDIEIIPNSQVVAGITFNNINISQGFTRVIDLDEPANQSGFNKVYSINPLIGDVNDTFTVTSTASASSNILYKCSSWNFTTQTCPGDWIAWQTITPGQQYNATFTVGDPGLAEGSGLWFEGFETNNLNTNNWTTSTTGGTNWYINTVDPYVDTYHLYVENINGEATIETNISTEGYGTIEFSFYAKTAALDLGEYIAVDWYNGTGWTNVLPQTQTIAVYTLYSYSLGSTAEDNPDLRIRFRCSDNSNNEICLVDNVQITGIGINDSTPPGSVTNLANQSRDDNWIYWNWTEPVDIDFNQSIVFIDGSNTANTSNNYYNATGLAKSTSYTITIHTKDANGNINNTDVNSTVITSCTASLTNTSWTAWYNTSSCYVNDTIDQTRNLTQYDSNSCGGANTTYYEYQSDACDYCTPSMTNTSWTAWYNTSSCYVNDTIDQTRNRTQYDTNNCGEISNSTAYEYQADACDYCTPSMTNTSWTSWSNITCLSDDTMNQTRNLTQYDSNSCGEVSNTTYVEYQNTASCDYCTPSLTNTSWTAWYNTSSCYVNDTIDQTRNLTQYDTNNCGEVSNSTSYEYQTGSCVSPPSSITNLNNQSSDYDWIYWNWTNPSEADFNESIIFIDGTNTANSSNNYYNATGLTIGTSYTITVHTKDNNGNINSVDVNSTAKTLTQYLTSFNGSFIEDFESNSLDTNKWSVSGVGASNWTITNSPGNVYAGTYAGYASNTNGRTTLENAISTESYTNIVLNFYYKAKGIDATDEFLIDWYDGTSWINLYNGSGAGDISYTLSSNSLNSNADNNSDFKIRFICNVNAGTEYCAVDNLQIYESVPCTPSLTNTSWTGWYNTSSCYVNDTIDQTRNLTQYDSNSCGGANTTYYEYQTDTCDYCTPSMTNTSWTAWYNTSSCYVNDTLDQTRNLTQYDSNNCGEVSNSTSYEYQTDACISLPSSITNLANQSKDDSWIYWNWTNPSEADFNESIIFIDGTNTANTSNNYYNATGLTANTDHIITVHTKDNNGNINSVDVNSTAKTAIMYLLDFNGMFLEDFESNSLDTNSWSITGESTLNNWTITNSPGNVYAGNYSAYVDDTNGRTTLENAISTQGYTNIALNFYYKAKGIDATDEFLIDWYDGTSWINLYNGSGAGDISYTLSSNSLNSNADNNSDFKIRFICNVNAGTEYCAVDNIQIIGSDGETPSSVTNLNNQSAGSTWIYWNWTNPEDIDFNQNIIFIDSNNTANSSNNYYNATGLTPNINYTITLHTKDNSGDINNTDVNSTAITADDCIPSMTNTSWTAWYNISICYVNDTIDKARNLTQYDSNICGEISNSTHYEYQTTACDYCTPSLTNTSWTAWYNTSSCYINDTFDQTRNLTQYDATDCGEISNSTYYEYQAVACDYCTPSLTNNSWTSWTNISCLIDDTMNQTRNLTQYDTNSCGEISNTTFVEYRSTESCDYCTPSLTNTSWTSWTNISCLINDKMNQTRNLTQYDNNGCGEIGNSTYYEYQATADCSYCTPSLTNTSWTAWYNTSSCYINDTLDQTRNLTQYDTNSCGGANTTYYEYQSDSCTSILSSITNLNNQSSGRNWVYWNWTNPLEVDFNQSIIFIDGSNTANTSNNYYNATGLTPNLDYTITVHTKDNSENINNTDVNSTAKATATSLTFNGTFFEDFETGNLSTNTWTLTGTTSNWTIDITDPYAGTYHISAENTQSEAIIQTSIDTLGYEDLTLSFYVKTAALDSGEYVAAEWYNGADWITVLAQTQDIAAYSLYSYELASTADNNEDFKIRFRCLSNSNNEFCEVDDISLTGTEIDSEPTPSCGDGTCNGAETCSTCSADCGTCSTGGGGGGGGGSSSTTKEQCRDRIDNDRDGLIDYPADPGCINKYDNDETEGNCVETWSCSGWYECVDKKQARVCIDANDCGTAVDKPSETQPCVVEDKIKEYNFGSFEGDKLSFIYKSEEHQITIQEVKENSAILIIESEPIEVELFISQQKDVDITEDGVNDIRLILNNVEGKEINLTLKIIIYEEYAKERIPGKVTGKSIEILPEEAPNMYYIVPTILLLIILVAIIALKKTHLSRKIKRIFTIFHVVLVAVILLLLLASFFESSITGLLASNLSTSPSIDVPKDKVSLSTAIVTIIIVTGAIVLLIEQHMKKVPHHGKYEIKKWLGIKTHKRRVEHEKIN